MSSKKLKNIWRLIINPKLLELRKLHVGIKNCKQCVLHKERLNVVSGIGHYDPKVAFVGEAPGKEEDKTGYPFQGESGLILYRWIEELRLLDTEFSILNIVKCKPPNNRDPMDEEVSTCTDLWLKKQLDILEPEVIVSVGRIASAYFLGKEFKSGILTYAGKFYGNTYPMIHPSYFLRRGSKPNEWEPYLTKLKEKLNV